MGAGRKPTVGFRSGRTDTQTSDLTAQASLNRSCRVLVPASAAPATGVRGARPAPATDHTSGPGRAWARSRARQDASGQKTPARAAVAAASA